MADVIRKATNRFIKGLVMDFSPENTKNELLTHALNATLLTFNGNELSLQNDMGNARVETAYLPEGYMPVGTCEYGGIIYIVSYNPLEDKSQIGCFPSPERNISSDELGISDKYIDRNYFQKFIDGVPDESGTILHNTQYVLLKNDNLNPGDKFIVCSDKQIYNEKLQNLFVAKDKGEDQAQESDFKPISNPVIALNVVSIEDSGKIVYLNSDIRHYEVQNSYQIDEGSHTDTYKYHILGKMMEGTSQLAKEDLDSYRDVLSSGYSVFKSKTSGRLAILAELIMIDSYSVTHSVVPRKDESDKIVEGAFDIIIHTDITPTINESNYNLVPKLQYYYLDNSQGYIQVAHPTKVNDTIPLFEIDKDGKNTGKYNLQFLDYYLSDVYEQVPGETLNLNQTLRKAGQFNFPKPYTYNGRMISYDGEVTGTANNSVFTKFIEGKYHRLSYNQISDNIDYYKDDIMAKFYYFDASGKEYQEYTDKEINESYTYYIEKPAHIYHDAKRDKKYNTPEQELYKLITVPKAAEDVQIEDKTIEKYQYQEIITFRKATAEEVETSSDKLYYKDDTDGTYIQLIGQPDPNTDYYIRESEENLVPIGKDVVKEEIKGAVYYYPDAKTYELASEEDKKKYFDFVTYPYTPTEPYGSPINLYRKEEKWEYEVATQYQIINYKELNIKLYYSTNYILVPEIEHYGQSNQLFIVVPMDTFVASKYFVPNTSDNRINGRLKPEGIDEPEGGYPKDDEIFLYTVADFIPNNDDKNDGNYLNYNALKLANIKIPSVVSLNGLDLPFKYDYTIVPCMNYGKLQHLAVSNTVDFGKLHAFNQSDFTTWKYRIDDNQLRLTFGADVYDTYETNKVDGLVLEFYDCWGFAGSLEIVDKKSYSGIFTKVIPLNALQGISNRKILDNSYTEDYRHNINILQKTKESGEIIENEYIFNGDDAKFMGSSSGWDIDKTHNDCGTLYSNIIYGVKTYLRRSTENGIEFIPKREFFLYTLPIFNDFYYQLDDFSSLKNPELDLMLTYKLKDSSTKSDYNADGIVNGYGTSDKENVDNYLNGSYDITRASSFDITKYYKYKGTTEVYLEVGLKKDYEPLNISYSPEINKYFTCKLWLLSDDNKDKSFTVNSGVDGLSDVSQILNYNNTNPAIQTSVNKLEFERPTDASKPFEIEIKPLDFYGSNFIHNIGENPIKLNYEFVVGYTANISNIRNTQVQATTICALFHVTSDGQYNYEDFGVYEQTDPNETNPDGSPKTNLLSSIMFYNEGTAEKEVFGICKQISIASTDNMSKQCQSISYVETDSQDIKTAGKLNAGDPLKQLISNIGKLTFCQPHAHGLSEVNGVNLHEGNSTNNYGIPSEAGGGGKYGDMDSNDKTYGIAPRDYLFKHPKYNLCLNTKNSINYYSEFISTLDYKEISSSIWLYNTNTTEDDAPHWYGPTTLREYSGFTGSDISTFNKKMLETMKHVYAYNPDYDSLTVNLGNIALQTYNPNFTSNLLSIDSKLELGTKIFNDFLYLGPINLSTYLTLLEKHSKNVNGEFIKTTDKGRILSQLEFKPGFDYCGTPENYYLISQLTYNTPVPQEIEAELEFSTSDNIVIKHHDGSNTFMKGSPNKKVLYGYNQDYDKMIQLDVSNYSIDSEGVLKVKNDGAIEEQTKSLTAESTTMNTDLFRGTYNTDYTFTNMNGESIDLKLHLSLERSGMLQPLVGSESGFFLGIQYDSSYSEGNFNIIPRLYITQNKSNYNYQVKVNSITFRCLARVLNDKTTLTPYSSAYNDVIPLSEQKFSSLEDLAGDSPYKYPPLVDMYGAENTNNPTSYYWAFPGEMYQTIYANDVQLNVYADIPSSNTVTVNQYGEIKFRFHRSSQIIDSAYLIGLIGFFIEKIDFTITQTSKLENDPVQFISTMKYNNYWEFKDSKYQVKDNYKKTRLRGSSITLNDLVYEPNKDGHRLFIRNNCYVYNPYLRGKFYYRLLDPVEGRKTWHYNSKYLNNIFFFTGPCYTNDNLNYNSTIDG